MAEEFAGLRLARRWVKRHIPLSTIDRPIVLVFILGLFFLWGFAQSLPTPQHHATISSRAHTSRKKHKPQPPLISESAPQPAPPPALPPALTPEQMPPRTPEVVWDGKMLSIDAENSTLSDILVAVRTRTGAAIDMPPGAASERMAARLGPAPIREVLTSLFSGTNYDYIIQASDTNDDEIASVILTPRGKDDALANTSISASSSGVRRGPGYTASGKHTFEVMPDTPGENAAPTEVAAEGVEDNSQATASAPTETATAVVQSSADSPEQPDSSGTPATAMAMPDARSGLPNAQPGAGSSAGTFGQMVQNMQQLFEQRRQIQMQQNQAIRNQSTSPTN